MKVAVALITDDACRFLITQRPMHVSQGGVWEFPGGKLEEEESAERALVRELKEELGIEALQFVYLGQVNYQYSEYAVELEVFHVYEFFGAPTCLEGQLSMQWADYKTISGLPFPKANERVMDFASDIERQLKL